MMDCPHLSSAPCGRLQKLIALLPGRDSAIGLILFSSLLLALLLSPESVFARNWTIFACCSLLLLLPWLRFTFRRFLDPSALPGPLTLPIIGSLATINAREPQRSVLQWRKKFGNVFIIKMPKETIVIAGYYELKKAATMSETSARPNSYLYSIFLKEKIEGNGTILSSGKTWKAARSFAAKHLHESGVNDESISRSVEHHASNMVDIIEKTIDQEGPVINLHRAVAYTVASIIYEIVLGRKCDFTDSRLWTLKELLDGVLEYVQGVQMLIADSYSWLERILPGDKEYRRLGFELQAYFLRELALNREKLESETNNNIRIHEEISPDNIFAKYLAHPSALVNGDMDIVVLAGDVWTGGMETTLTATRWAIIYFMGNPEVQERLHEEVIRRYPRNGNGEFSWTTRAELPYLCAVLDEVLRLANVLPWNIPHRALKTFKLGGQTIKEGASMMFSFSSVHHDEEIFPDPFRFNPERFLRRVPNEEEREEWTRMGRDLSQFIIYEKDERLCPFGMGQRKCPGEKLAMKELFVFVIKLIQRFRFVTVESSPPDMKRRMGMTSTPREFVTRVVKREDWYNLQG